MVDMILMTFNRNKYFIQMSEITIDFLYWNSSLEDKNVQYISAFWFYPDPF